MKVSSNGLEFEVEIQGPENGAVVLMIMGLGMQLIEWPPSLVRALTTAGYRVVRFDNRDIGLSSKTNVRVPNLVWQAMRYRMGFAARSAYTLRDMVEDTRGVLDALGIERCHVIGASMGGMIAQGLASHYPSRVLTLTSIMSTTGARGLPQATPHATMALLSRPKTKDREALIAHFAKVFRVIASPAYPTDENELRTRIGVGLDRSYYPAGTIKQLSAIMASGDRSDEVRCIQAPTLIIHGRKDPLIPLKNGEDTAAKIPDARLEIIDGMGHDLPPAVIQTIMEMILPFFARHAQEI